MLKSLKFEAKIIKKQKERIRIRKKLKKCSSVLPMLSKANFKV